MFFDKYCKEHTNIKKFVIYWIQILLSILCSSPLNLTTLHTALLFKTLVNTVDYFGNFAYLASDEKLWNEDSLGLHHVGFPFSIVLMESNPKVASRSVLSAWSFRDPQCRMLWGYVSPVLLNVPTWNFRWVHKAWKLCLPMEPMELVSKCPIFESLQCTISEVLPASLFNTSWLSFSSQ